MSRQVYDEQELERRVRAAMNMPPEDPSWPCEPYDWHPARPIEDDGPKRTAIAMIGLAVVLLSLVTLTIWL